MKLPSSGPRVDWREVISALALVVLILLAIFL